jgi:hypothetical protein
MWTGGGRRDWKLKMKTKQGKSVIKVFLPTV